MLFRTSLFLLIASVCLSSLGLAKDRRSAEPFPDQFTVARRTFFDFGPPFNYYEILWVNREANFTSVSRALLTPAAGCYQPPKVEIVQAKTEKTLRELLHNESPCSIPEKELRKERKRCKHCLIFSGADVALQVQCGNQTRLIRSDILDRDMFDPHSNTPKHTSWTMQLLRQLDDVLGAGVMDKPVFAVDDSGKDSIAHSLADPFLEGLSNGKFDALFGNGPERPSELYKQSLVPAPTASVELVDVQPERPDNPTLPIYPPIAKAARVEGIVVVRATIDRDGNAAEVMVETGHPMLKAAVVDAVRKWKFPTSSEVRSGKISVSFKTNCSNSK